MICAFILLISVSICAGTGVSGTVKGDAYHPAVDYLELKPTSSSRVAKLECKWTSNWKRAKAACFHNANPHSSKVPGKGCDGYDADPSAIYKSLAKIYRRYKCKTWRNLKIKAGCSW